MKYSASALITAAVAFTLLSSLDGLPLAAQTNYSVPSVVTTIAGAPPGDTDGTGSAARFSSPRGLAIDGTGNLYVADSSNETIRKISPSGAVTTLAGLSGAWGSTNGTGTAARFNWPNAVAVDGTGNVYVSDTGNHVIRKITAGGVVTTLAGSPGVEGEADGTGSAANFDYPWGIAVDASGNVFVLDNVGQTLRKVTPDGVVTTLAGSAYHAGTTDGTGSVARFAYPDGLAIDSAGNLYVGDHGGQTIRKVTPAGDVTTLAGSPGAVGSTDGTGSGARFDYPGGVAVDTSGNVYVADKLNDTIRVVSAAGVVTTLAGSPKLNGAVDATGSNARFDYPTSVAVDGSGNVYVADFYNNVIRKITSAGAVSTLAGSFGGPGGLDGTGANARFRYPYGMAMSASGLLYVADLSNNEIRSVTPAGAVSTFAGNLTTGGFTLDGAGSAAGFDNPRGVAANSAGTLYVTQRDDRIRAITSAAIVTTFAGTGAAGSLDGTGTNASFSSPNGIATDSSGNIYVADSNNDIIRKVTPIGVVTTFAGTAGLGGNVDGVGSAATFNVPTGIAIDAHDVLYVCDSFNNTIRKVLPDGTVTTIAGSPTSGPGAADGTGSAAQFNYPQAIAVDSAGNLFVADENHAIRLITGTGAVSTVAGIPGRFGHQDGAGISARFFFPTGIAIDASNNIYVVDENNSCVREITVAPIFNTPLPDKAVAGSGTVTFTPTVAGTGALSYQWNFNGQPIAGATSSSYTIASAKFANSGSYSVTVSNSTGSTTSNAAVLTVNVPPFFLGQPLSTVAKVGSTKSISVVASGTAPLTFQWTLNGAPISGATSSTYTITSAALSDAGSYACTVTNGQGSVTSFPATLVVGDTATYSPAYTISTIAGQAPGSADGSASTAGFDLPMGVALDGLGNLYIADSFNQTIRKLSSLGIVSTFAGYPGKTGTDDGLGLSARFNFPESIAADAAGNLYVADTDNETIRKISPTGAVTTLAGVAEVYGYADGAGTAAIFNQPRGIAVDASGNVYVADTGNDVIRAITPTGVVTTLAGMAGLRGSTDATGAAARFRNPNGVAVDGSGNVYVADTYNYTVRKITPSGVVSTLAGSALHAGTTDGTGAAARFSYTRNIAVDSAGNVYVADKNNQTIRKITPVGVVITLAGAPGAAGGADGTGSAARFNWPEALVCDGTGNVFVADTYNLAIRKITAAQVVTTYAGFAHSFGSMDGASTAATFFGPTSVAVDSAGNLFVADASNYTIRKIAANGTVTTLAGTAGVFGSTDATGAAASFFYPASVAVDSGGNVFVADTDASTIRKISPLGVVTTFAGTVGNVGSIDATGAAASFGFPSGVAVDASGNVYVADPFNENIRKITPAGAVSTLAGNTGVAGSADGTGSAATFDGPNAVAADSAGNVYVADGNNDTIRKITPAGAVTTLAGSPHKPGATDGNGASARFSNLTGIAVDAAGNVYVADNNASTIRKVTPTGTVTTLAGIPGVSGGTDGLGGSATFNFPSGIAVDALGTLYIADQFNNTIRRGSLAPSITSQPSSATVLVGATATFSTVANGTGAMTYQWYWNGNPIAGATSATYTIPSTATTDAGTYTVTVTNSVGSATSDSATLVVNAPPTITAGPADVTVLAGESAMFTVTATGTAPLAYQWSFNGSPIQGATAASYTIAATTTANAGSYSVVVTNAFGTTTSTSAKLTVNIGPSISTQPADSTVIAGSPATFSVVAGGTMPLTYQWSLNGSPIANATAATYTIAAATVADSGTYTCTVANAFGSSTSSAATLTVNTAPAITTEPSNVAVITGSSASFTVAATGNPTPTFQWTHNNTAIPGATSATYTIDAASTADVGSYRVTVTNSIGSVTSTVATLAVTAPAANAPTITREPKSQTVASGHTVVFTCDAAVTPGTASAHKPSPMAASTTTYQWLFNGVALSNGTTGSTTVAGATTATLVITNPTDANVGVYLCTVTTSAGTAMSMPATLAVNTSLSDTSRLVNVSCRAQVGTGANVLIPGFVVGGGSSGTMPVLIRASGPALSKAPFNLPGTLADPTISLHQSVNSQDQIVAANTGWAGSPDVTTMASAVGAFGWGTGATADSAVIQNVTGGNYTALVSGALGTGSDTGIALTEVYDATPSSSYFSGRSPRLLNISARGQVGTGANVMIAGFVIGGKTSMTLLIRASGPALSKAPFNVPGTLADPKLEIHQTVNGADTIVASNTGWGGDAQIAAAADKVGAFGWGSSPTADSAVLVTLPPGSYTAILSGAANDSGVALIEVYEVQ